MRSIVFSLVLFLSFEALCEDAIKGVDAVAVPVQSDAQPQSSEISAGDWIEGAIIFLLFPALGLLLPN